MKHKAQYRWYQVDYQLGVLVSRSSVNLIRIKRLWIMPVLQFVNVVLVLVQILHPYMPNIWLMFAVVFFEGLLGGAAYVNTFYTISKQVCCEKRAEFTFTSKESSHARLPVSKSFCFESEKRFHLASFLTYQYWNCCLSKQKIRLPCEILTFAFIHVCFPCR